MNNVERLKQGYRDFAKGNLEAVIALFHPEIEWNECTGFPFSLGDGIYNGPNEIVQNVFAQLPNHYDGFQIDIKELFGSGDKVVMVGNYKGVWKETGKDFTANATQVWTVDAGKITHFFQAVDTAEIINP